MDLTDAGRQEWDAKIAELQRALVSTLPGRRCARPDHNGGEGSEGRVYGYMCGGCAFELAQEEADAARTEQREANAKIADEWQEVAFDSGDSPSQICRAIAAAIRARLGGK